MSDTAMLASIAGLFGLIIGSFLNVCIHRLPRDLSVVWPGSRCPECGHPIAPYDNIPVLSYVLLGARCRACRTAISWRYPAVELLTAALFAAAVVVWGPTGTALRYAVFFALSVGMVFADLETRLLPDEFTLGGLWVGLGLSALLPPPGGLLPGLFPLWPPWVAALVEAALAAALTSGALWSIAFLYSRVRKREGLGFGDVKMVAMIGAFLGLPATLLTIFAGCVVGTVIGLAYIRLSGKDPSTYELPFGSFLGAAGIAVPFWMAIR